jgi:hypothetical protein
MCAIDPRGVGGEASLRAGDADRAAREQFSVVLCDSCESVAFGHRQRVCPASLLDAQSSPDWHDTVGSA